MTSFDLRARARRAVIAQGFTPDFPAQAKHQAQELEEKYAVIPPRFSDVRDLRDLNWSSIDNRESRDLDQVEVAQELEGGAIRILVGIADVASLVEKNSAIDVAARHNSTSVYTGVETFPMLPDELSSNLTSLVENADRLAIVIEMDVAQNGAVARCEVYRALVRNKAKLAYESVGAWLEGDADLPEAAREAHLESQLRLQDRAAQRLLDARRAGGALDFETIEATPIVEDGRVVDLKVIHKNRARALIENFMVTANSALADWLRDAGSLSIGRVVRRPQRWSRIVILAAQNGTKLPGEPDAKSLADFLAARKLADPAHYADLSLSIVKLLGPGEYAVEAPGQSDEGHFGLALAHYAHATAPNRRYADLVTQRLVMAVLDKSSAPYDKTELEDIAQGCNDRESGAQKVERTMRKVAAAALFGERIGDSFDAIVTGAGDKGVYVRTLSPPVEGRVMRGQNLRDADVGDRVRVRLVDTNIERGWIDFELI